MRGFIVGDHADRDPEFRAEVEELIGVRQAEARRDGGRRRPRGGAARVRRHAGRAAPRQGGRRAVKRSAGVLLRRGVGRGAAGASRRAVLGKKDQGAWSIPKGEYADGEDPRGGARREFAEELGSTPARRRRSTWARCASRRTARRSAWAAEGDLDAGAVVSNTFEMEWPPRAVATAAFPEVDRAEWFDIETARAKLNPAQAAFLDRLTSRRRPARSSTPRSGLPRPTRLAAPPPEKLNPA